MKHTQENKREDRVIPVHELIYKDLDKLLGHKLTRAELKQATDYVMESGNKDYFRGVRVGLNLSDQDRAKLYGGEQ
jgi:hypothetical protein